MGDTGYSEEVTLERGPEYSEEVSHVDLQGAECYNGSKGPGDPHPLFSLKRQG